MPLLAGAARHKKAGRGVGVCWRPGGRAGAAPHPRRLPRRPASRSHSAAPAGTFATHSFRGAKQGRAASASSPHNIPGTSEEASRLPWTQQDLLSKPPRIPIRGRGTRAQQGGLSAVPPGPLALNVVTRWGRKTSPPSRKPPLGPFDPLAGVASQDGFRSDLKGQGTGPLIPKAQEANRSPNA